MLLLYFFFGSVCFLFRDCIPQSSVIFAGCLLSVGLSLWLGAFGLIAPFALSYMCLWLAFKLRFSRFEARGDFSYGIYIYAFPVQQVLAFLGVQDGGFAAYFSASLLCTAVLAFLSYRFVEAPCLRWKSAKLPAFLTPAISRSPADCSASSSA